MVTKTERTIPVTENYKYLVPADGKLESYGHLMEAVGKRLVELSNVEGLEYELDIPWVCFSGPESLMRECFGDEAVDQELEWLEEDE